MSDERIKILDETTANKIAAGEVVERPASAVKELVENSIDAGSTRIEVEIQEGGLRLIRVTDNGYGMGKNDARLSLARHATSKIQTAEDLNRVSTLGFRGEALPSIASVSRFTVITRRTADLEGTEIVVEGGQISGVSAVGCPAGTTIMVRDLFFNTPARLKYLKTTTTEAGHIADILNRLALAYPHISFRLMHNGRQLLATTGAGDGRETMASIYGGEVAKQLLTIEGARDTYRVFGFIAKPVVYRKNRHHETIFVNRRFIHSRLISRAFEDAFQSLLPSGAHPIGVISVELPSSEVDVNVHPTKSEVKFQKERDIFLLVYHAVKDALQKACLIPEASLAPKQDLGVTEYKVQPLLLHEEAATAPKGAAYATGTPSVTPQEPPLFFRDPQFRQPSPAPGQTQSTTPQANAVAAGETAREAFPLLQPVGQIDNTYIVAQGVDGMYLIDQHAAHERILFEKLMGKKQSGNQSLLVPWVWETTAQEALCIRENLAVFQELGFEVEEFGTRSFRVCALPLGVPTALLDKILQDFLQRMMETGRQQSVLRNQELLMIMTACKAAIKAHAKLSMPEMLKLLQQLADAENPFTCPHGRPTIVHFSGVDLARLFKRIQ